MLFRSGQDSMAARVQAAAKRKNGYQVLRRTQMSRELDKAREYEAGKKEQKMCIRDRSMRVLKPEGVLLICASWKRDKVIMEESLLPFLDERHYSCLLYTS